MVFAWCTFCSWWIFFFSKYYIYFTILYILYYVNNNTFFFLIMRTWEENLFNYNESTVPLIKSNRISVLNGPMQILVLKWFLCKIKFLAFDFVRKRICFCEIHHQHVSAVLFRLWEWTVPKGCVWEVSWQLIQHMIFFKVMMACLCTYMSSAHACMHSLHPSCGMSGWSPPKRRGWGVYTLKAATAGGWVILGFPRQ